MAAPYGCPVFCDERQLRPDLRHIEEALVLALVIGLQRKSLGFPRV
jgi:hypothetical protein